MMRDGTSTVGRWAMHRDHGGLDATEQERLNMFLTASISRLGWIVPCYGVILALQGCGRFGFDLQDVAPPPAGGSGCSAPCDSGDPSASAETDGTTTEGTDGGSLTGDGKVAGREPPVDASVPDADGGAPSTPPACDQGVFCSGFESPLLEEWDRIPKLNGTANLQSSVVHAGQGALSAAASPPTGAAFVSKTGLGPYWSGSFHTRAYYFVPSSAAGLSLALMSIDPTPLVMADGITLLATADGFGISVNSAEGPALYSGKTAVPFDRWFCLELELQLSDTKGVATIRLDGSAEDVATDIDTLPLLGVTQVSVGIALAQASASKARVFVDDFVADTNPIGCD